MINESMMSGIYPDVLKFTEIVPIQKVKGTTKLNEMRPVNMSHQVDKVMQCWVKEQLEKHINKNKLIDERQSAYRPGHSCESAINLVLNEWLMLIYQKKFIIAVFLDLSRAFETIDRINLLIILRMSGVDGTVFHWFES